MSNYSFKVGVRKQICVQSQLGSAFICMHSLYGEEPGMEQFMLIVSIPLSLALYIHFSLLFFAAALPVCLCSGSTVLEGGWGWGGEGGGVEGGEMLKEMGAEQRVMNTPRRLRHSALRRLSPSFSDPNLT